MKETLNQETYNNHWFCDMIRFLLILNSCLLKFYDDDLLSAIQIQTANTTTRLQEKFS